jgi:hypothetical protein
MVAMASNFQWFPVASLPSSWYRTTSVTLDLGGHLPSQQDIVPSDTSRNLLADQLASIVYTYGNLNSGKYEFHWRHFGSFEPGYRDRSCTTGGYPWSVSAFVVSGSPKDYFTALNRGMGELNTRPQWMAPEEYR